jgi:hypothetical protein
MVNSRGVARLGTLAVGLGIGLAAAATPVVAVADSSTDWVNDLFGFAALPAPAVPDVNLAISIDGYSLVSEGTASADSGQGDIAIAYGDFASASAGGGAVASAGGLRGDTGADYDSAIDYATGGNFLYDILSPAGDLPGTAAATSGGFLAELLSLF